MSVLDHGAATRGESSLLNVPLTDRHTEQKGDRSARRLRGRRRAMITWSRKAMSRWVPPQDIVRTSIQLVLIVERLLAETGHPVRSRH